jgi:hypothetical protein
MKRLADYNHHYECSNINCHSPKTKLTYKTFDEFYSDFVDSEINFNLIFRWDVKRRDDGSCYCDLFMIQQRHGVFLPIHIKCLTEIEEARLQNYLKQHWQYLKDIWAPISI